MQNMTVENLIKNWEKRNILGLYCENKDKAVGKILATIPLSASVGISGSVTLDQLGIVKLLEERGNKVFNQYKNGISRNESLDLRNKGAQADYYLASANAISLNGELVFFSGYGNRVSGIANAKNVIIVSGVNKITEDVASAMKRARDYATPLNCKRLNWKSPCFEDGACHDEICFFPEYKRMCCQILIIEGEILPHRFRVVLVDENMGF